MALLDNRNPDRADMGGGADVYEGWGSGMTEKEREELIEAMAERINEMRLFRSTNAEIARAALAVAEPVIKKDWQPMSTAPTDGTYVLAVVDVWRSSTGKFLGWGCHIVSMGDCGEAQDTNGDYVGWDWDDFKFWKPLEFPSEPEAREHD